MKKSVLPLTFLLTVCLLLSGCHTNADDAPGQICHNELRLDFVLPQEEYRLLDTAADDLGAAALYEVIGPSSSSLDPAKRSLFVQFFSPDGRHLLTSDCLGYFYDDTAPAISELLFSDTDLSFCVNGETYYAAQRTTGAAASYSFQPVYEQDGCTLKFATQYYYTQGTSQLLFRYTDAAGQQTLISCAGPVDENLNMALYEAAYSTPDLTESALTQTLFCQLDPTAKTAVVSNTKLTYTLDFAAGSYTVQRSYTPQMLSDEPAAVSPSGDRQLYFADEGGAGDLIWRDLVLLDASGLRYVGTYSLVSAVFVGEDAFVVEDTTSAFFYDADTLSASPVPGLTFAQVPRYESYTTPEKWILGLAYDTQNELLLAAVRDYSDDDVTQLPVTLLVMDRTGAPLREILTEYMVYPYRNNYTVRCALTLADKTVTLSSFYPDLPVLEVAYLK